VGVDQADPGEAVCRVATQGPYALRAALAAEGHPLAAGVIRSHPENRAPRARGKTSGSGGLVARATQGILPHLPATVAKWCRSPRGSMTTP
jgi:hypothetical protein